MNKWYSHVPKAIRFRRFERKRYAAFRSMHKVINIGVVTASMLQFALPDTVQAQKTVVANQINQEESVELDEIVVTASRAQNTLSQTPKIVTIISAREIVAAPVTSIQDLLEYAAGIDVRQRGEGGVQADISIRGGTFDQIAVLLNGINLSNPQIGHYSFDLPVNLSDIDHIEIISGPSSRIFGASAFTGAINIITKTEKENIISTSGYAGMHKLWNLGAAINHVIPHFRQRFSAGYTSSGGYTTNTDSKQLNLFWQSEIKSQSSNWQLQAGYNEKGYGANSFYSAAYPNQYDKTRSLFISAGGETTGKVKFIPKVYWARHFDRYELFRSNPADWYTGPNYHETNVFGANLNATTYWGFNKFNWGIEYRNEGVKSNVLGKLMDTPQKVPFEKEGVYTKSDNRSNLSGFLEYNLLLSRFTLSTGVLINYNSSLNENVHLYPGRDLKNYLGKQFYLYGNWNRALRMPTFTDLYYEGKTNKGNPNLKPEESEAFEIGIKYETKGFRSQIASFYRKGKNMIDWVKEKPEDIWESTNLTQVDNLGFETNLNIHPQELGYRQFFIQKIDLGYAFIHQNKNSQDYISNYALDYLKHKFTAQIHHSIYKGVSATWCVRWQDRAGSYTKYEELKPAYEEPYAPYCLVDLKINWGLQKLNLYMELNNLFNTKYYDLGNIPQPGIWVKTGVHYKLNY